MEKDKIISSLNTAGIERHRCKCCGEDIIYSNTTAKFWGGKLYVNGKSYQTVKNVNGVDYHLQVCEKCLLEKFPNIKNLSRIFNVMSEATSLLSTFLMMYSNRHVTNML